MAPSKIRKALGAVKDQTSIGLAKVGSSTVLAELEIAVVKATRHGEYPAEEKHVRDVLSLTSFSRPNVSACVTLLSRRLGKTRSWAVALKVLTLVHRLLAEGDPAFEQEVFFATRRGTRMLNMADFRDAGSGTGRWDFSAFVRTYALYLDERLEYRMQGRRHRGGVAALVAAAEASSPGMRRYGREEEGKEGEEGEEGGAPVTPAREMRADQLLSKAHHLQALLDRLLACRPTGIAQDNRIVAMALYPVVKESFQMYFDLTEINAAFVERFTELPALECVRVHDLFSKLSKLFIELDSFYAWSRSTGIARPSEYPDIEHITRNNLQVMEDFIGERPSLPNPQHPAQPAAQEPAPIIIIEDGETFQAQPHEEQEADGRASEVEADKELAAAAVAVTPVAASDELADFLHLEVEIPSSAEQHTESLALVLLDGGTTAAQPWEAFNETEEWEKALVETASNLAGQKPAFAGGFDAMTLEGMYSINNQPLSSAEAAVNGGSASSLAVVGRPAAQEMLALPAPAGSGCGKPGGSSDPFAASAAVAPPAWVQMSEMERKQRLLVEEQLLWQQYSREGRQGKLPVMGGGAYPYFMGGGYMQRF